ncbi:MAG: class I SAM-dependent methyltransferase [Candidatus Fermentibacterota bacterium]
MAYDDGEEYDRGVQTPYHRLWYGMVEERMQELLPGSGLLLDAGGGTGEFCLRAGRLRPGMDFVNLDLSGPMLATSLRKWASSGLEAGFRAVRGDMARLPLSSALFDVVLCLGDSLGYAADRERGFAELARVLRPGGLLWVSGNAFWGNFACMLADGPDMGFGAGKVREYYRTRWVGQGENSVHSFTTEELEDLARRNGLEVEEVFSTPVLGVHEDFLEDPEMARWVREVQVRYSSHMGLVERGNHINVVYAKPGRG